MAKFLNMGLSKNGHFWMVGFQFATACVRGAAAETLGPWGENWIWRWLRNGGSELGDLLAGRGGSLRRNDGEWSEEGGFRRLWCGGLMISIFGRVEAENSKAAC
ncbi:hypothetical protein BJ508DRAFT_300932 [Ascobolus immersus RN42]|uniref:Uncharacterized protein n=1 Tax=Ascobolus immersus RN42 TaxID=1160509 RepID=A0A3N4ITW2_ASCIM|nr:hypothetical protein BJ508DRAFT_300932 [Ascobolus immersus RN42]